MRTYNPADAGRKLRTEGSEASNWEETKQFLRALGKTSDNSRLRFILPKDHPKRREDKGKKSELNLKKALECQRQGYGTYLVIGHGGDSDSEINGIPALFVDDDNGRSLDELKRDIEITGLPAPSFINFSGKRGHHAYWLLKKPVVGKRFQEIQRKLIAALGTDRTIQNPSRVMRLPGFRHVTYSGGLGEMVRRVDKHEVNGELVRYDAEAIDRALPDEGPEIIEKVNGAGRAPGDLLFIEPPAGVELETAREALSFLDPDCDRDTWRRAAMALMNEYPGREEEAFEVWHDWSASGTSQYNGEESCLDEWKTIRANPGDRKPVTIRTLLKLAKEAGWKPKATQRSKNAQAAFEPVEWFPASDLENVDPPPREWLAPQMIPVGDITLLSGDGGTGKSLLALQLAYAVANGGKWMGTDTKAGNVLFLTAEDDKDELHRRLHRIAEFAKLPSVAELLLGSLAGMDAVLASGLPGSPLGETQRFREIEERVAESKPVLLVLDTAADLYGANENDRALVRQFISLLRGLAIRYRVAIVLLSHPSLSGMNSGSGTSGSTAWSNSVRSRLYLGRVKTSDGREPDPDARVLTTKKSNYGPVGTEIGLKWVDGIFLSTGAATSENESRAEKADRTFVDLLRLFTSQNRKVNANPGPNYAPKKFAEHIKSGGLSNHDFRAAMERLLNAGKIRSEEFGPPSKPRNCLVLVDSVNRKFSVKMDDPMF